VRSGWTGALIYPPNVNKSGSKSPEVAGVFTSSAGIPFTDDLVNTMV
jgi:hypothetical protein